MKMKLGMCLALAASFAAAPVGSAWAADAKGAKDAKEEKVSKDAKGAKEAKADEEKTNEVTAKVYTLIDLIGSFPDAANSSPAEPAANEEISDVLLKTYFQGMADGKFESAEQAAEQFWAEAQEIWAKSENQ